MAGDLSQLHLGHHGQSQRSGATVHQVRRPSSAQPGPSARGKSPQPTSAGGHGHRRWSARAQPPASPAPAVGAGHRSSGSLPRISGTSQNSPAITAAGRNVRTAATANRLPTSATAPNTTSPTTAPMTPEATHHPVTDARTEVGNSSVRSEPAAGAKTEPDITPRM